VGLRVLSIGMERQIDRYRTIDGKKGMIRVSYCLLGRFLVLKQSLVLTKNSKVLEWLLSKRDAHI
jgi:hypothetical protein